MNKPVPSEGGASDFLARLEPRHKVWAFVAAEAPVGMISGAIADELGQAVFFEKATFRPPAKVDGGSKASGDSAPEAMATDWIAIVKSRHSPWTVAFLTLAPRAPHYLSRLFPLAQELAETLGVRAFAACRDEEGEVECRLYDNGDATEELAFVPGEAFRRWRSSRREAPALERVELTFVGDLCAGLGLRIPAGYPAVRADEAFFAAEADQDLERVDLLLPPAPAEETMVFEEDETVIFQAGELEVPVATESENLKVESAGWGVKAWWGRLFGGRG